MTAPAPGKPLRGRGASWNPANRFTKLSLEEDPENPATEYFRDLSRSALSYNDSPDIPFRVSLNPYRGCSHGCIYCYARPTHEYFGLSAGLDFETKIFVKEDAPELLRRELSSPKWKPQVIAMSGVTDCYQPGERRLQITRRCLEVLAEFRNPVSIITKNHLVLRDLDLLSELARHNAAAVSLSVTTLDVRLSRKMEPRTSSPEARLQAVRALNEAGVPAGVMVAPVIPGLTDHEIPAILSAAARAGSRWASYVLLRLPYAVKDLFVKWLEEHFPERKNKVLNRIRQMKGGGLNDSRFFHRFEGTGPFADEIEKLFEISRRKAGIPDDFPSLSTASFRRPSTQLELFSADLF